MGLGKEREWVSQAVDFESTSRSV